LDRPKATAAGAKANASTTGNGAAPPAEAASQAPPDAGRREPAAPKVKTAAVPRPEAVDAAFASLGPGWQFESGLLWGRLNALHDQVDSAAQDRLYGLRVSTTVPLIVVAGFVLLRLWMNYWAASATAGAPLWQRGAQHLDPLAILETWEKEIKDRGENDTLPSLVA
jgi:hypothetical protein